MITKLRIKNFKSLQDTGELEIRPLTFLVGPNSSGKSSLIQMLLILRQTVDSTDVDNPLTINNGWVNMGAYPEFIYKGEYKRQLEVNLEFSIAEYARYFHDPQLKLIRPKLLRLDASFSYNRKTTQIVLKERTTTVDGALRQQIIRSDKTKKYQSIITDLGDREQTKIVRNDVKPLKFYDYFIKLGRREKITSLQGTSPTGPERFFILRGGFVVEEVFRNLFYLGPLREFPKRFYVTSGQAPQDVGIAGERAVDVLWFTHRSKRQHVTKIEKEAITWLKNFNFASSMRLERVSKGNYYRVVITDPVTGVETNLADIGFGASQTLPIIIESFYSPPNSIILIEQPEIHLHPKAQATLGDLFIQAINDEKRTFVIETHSEHILARVRRRIAEKKLNMDQVAIYYFEPTVDGTRIQEVTLNKQGQYESFPKGFFDEDVQEAFEHLKALKD